MGNPEINYSWCWASIMHVLFTVVFHILSGGYWDLLYFLLFWSGILIPSVIHICHPNKISLFCCLCRCRTNKRNSSGLFCILVYLNKVSWPQALWKYIVFYHYIGFRWYPSIYLCFRDSSINDPAPMYIIAPVWQLQYGCVSKDALNHHLITIRMSYLSTIGRWRVTLMYLNTLTRFTRSSSNGILTQVHKKEMYILMYFLALDVTNSSSATMWWNTIARSSSSTFCLS